VNISIPPISKLSIGRGEIAPRVGDSLRTPDSDRADAVIGATAAHRAAVHRSRKGKHARLWV